MRTVRILEAASEEAIEAIAWYENEEPGLGLDLQRSIDTALDLLEEDVIALVPVPGKTAHFSRRPGYWRDRVKS